MKSAVVQAIKELRCRFPESDVKARDTGDGGAVVTIDRVDVGDGYTPMETWVGFCISYQYPHADIYPLFVRADLTRVDGGSHGEGITLQTFEGQPALQLSRRSNRLNPETDTAALKVIKVIEWLRTQ